MKEIRECHRHGFVGHYPYQRKNRPSLGYKCSKCNTENVTRKRRKLKIQAVEYLGGKCVRCDYNKSVSALEFHHRDPNEKDFGISTSGQTRSFEKMKVELDKCDLVCANCHREIHDEIS